MRKIFLLVMLLVVGSVFFSTPDSSTVYAAGEGRDTLYKYLDTVKVLYDKIDTTSAVIPRATLADNATTLSSYTFAKDSSGAANVDTVARCVSGMIRWSQLAKTLFLKETGSFNNRCYYAGQRGINNKNELFSGRTTSNEQEIILGKLQNDGDYVSVEVTSPFYEGGYMRVFVLYEHGDIHFTSYLRYQ